MFRKTSLNTFFKGFPWGKSNLRSIKGRNFASQAKPTTSEVNGDTKASLVEKTLGDLLVEKSNTYEHRDAFRPIQQTYRWTFTELLKWSNGVAHGLYDYELAGKDMLVSLGNEAEIVTVNFASTRLNLRTINIPLATETAQLGEALELAKPHSVLLNPKSIPEENFYEFFPEIENVKVEIDGDIHIRRFPQLKKIFHIGNRYYNGMTTFRELVSLNRRPDPLPKLKNTMNPTDVIIDFVTGGYGSNPSALQKNSFTHRSIASTSQFFGEKIKLRIGDRVLTALPLSSFEGQLGMWSNISHGAFTVIPSTKFQAEAVLKAATTEKCNYLFLQPQQAIEVFSHPNLGRYDVSNIESVLLVGSSDSSQLKKALDIVNAKTRAKQVFVYSDGVVFDFKNDGRGTPLSHVQVKVVDNKNSTAPLNASGTLVTKGIHNRKVTVSSKGKDESEWVSQGTQAKVDNEGFIHLV